MSRTVRRRVIYHGHVQGVGFRATARSVASRFPVSGYVRNQADGTVELVVEGPVRDVEALLIALGDEVSGHVMRADVAEWDDDTPLEGFVIRY